MNKKVDMVDNNLLKLPIINFNEMCRTCMSTNNYETFSPILYVYHEKNRLIDMLNVCAGIEISINDKLPLIICQKCIMGTVRSYEFKVQCEKSQTVMKDILQNLIGKINEEAKSGIDENVTDIKEEAEKVISNERMQDIEMLLQMDITAANPNSKEINKSEESIAGKNTESQSKEIANADEIQRNAQVQLVAKAGTNNMKKEKECSKDVNSEKTLTDADFVHAEPVKNNVALEVENIPGTNVNFPNITNVMSIAPLVPINPISSEPNLTSSKFVQIRPKPRVIMPLASAPASETFLRIQPAVKSGFKKKEQHPCEQCGKVFPCKSALKLHIRTHTGEKPYACLDCGKAFPSNNSLKSHMLMHTGEKRFQCSQCQRRFTRNWYLKLHMETHEEGTPNPFIRPKNHGCTICNRAYNASALKKHMREVHSTERPFVCETCGKDYNSKESLKRHMRIHKSTVQPVQRRFKCEECGKAFTWAQSFKEHVRTHKGEKPYLCSYCGKSFTSSGNFRNHLATHSSAGPGGPYKCPICNKLLGSKKTLHAHKVNAHSGRTYSCGVCGIEYDKPFALDKHMLSHIDVKDHPTCTICSKKFVKKGHLEVHMRKHTGDKPYLCPECGRRFAYLWYVKLHMRNEHSHDSELYKCDLCDKSFKSKAYVKMHMRTHTGEKPYACSVCGKDFAFKGTVRVHMRTHTGEKPYACSICDKGFCTSSIMKRHRKTHGKLETN